MEDQYLLAIALACAVAHLFGLSVVRKSYFYLIECWSLAMTCAMSCAAYAYLYNDGDFWLVALTMFMESLRCNYRWRVIKKRG